MKNIKQIILNYKLKKINWNWHINNITDVLYQTKRNNKVHTFLGNVS